MQSLYSTSTLIYDGTFRQLDLLPQDSFSHLELLLQIGLGIDEQNPVVLWLCLSIELGQFEIDLQIILLAFRVDDHTLVLLGIHRYANGVGCGQNDEDD